MYPGGRGGVASVKNIENTMDSQSNYFTVAENVNSKRDKERSMLLDNLRRLH